VTDEIAKRMKEWGCPQRAIRIALDTPAQTEAMQYARTFLREHAESDEAGILVLAGGVGVGKTVASVWAMSQYPTNASGSYGARRFRHVSELSELGLYGGDDQKREREVLKNLCRVLVIDDIGTEHKTDQFQTLFDGLMNARYEQDGITILTTNLTSDTFLERYGKRIYDRIRGRGQWYEIAHASLRGG
jgi:DNA replication protein DnaC